jgi:hypothetical protein
MNKKIIAGLMICLGWATTGWSQVNKAPSYPLITHSPYFSIWSNTDKLSSSTTTHWTGTAHSLIGLLKVDGQFYQFMGKEAERFNVVVPSSEEASYTVKYTETKPEGNWTSLDYDDSSWKEGQSPIGNFEGMSKVMWKGHDIWIRRVFRITDKSKINELLLKYTHDDGAEIMLNTEELYARKGAAPYRMLPLDKNKLKIGKNIIAMHVENTGGGARADIGLLDKALAPAETITEEALQKSVNVTATQTSYQFSCGKVELELAFTSPLLMDNLKLMTRPVSYMSYKLKSTDGKTHDVQLLLSAAANIAANSAAQELTASQYTAVGLNILKAGTTEQPVLQKKGDDLRIDWGYFYVAAPVKAGAKQFISSGAEAVKAFKSQQHTTSVSKGTNLALNTVIPVNKVGSEVRSGYLELAYDEIQAMQYFKENLRPWWNADGKSNIDAQLSLAEKEYSRVMQQCADFDRQVYADAVKSGGEEYAKLCVLAYRQSISAHQLSKSPKGELLWMSKENFSNGSINTVDVTYPSAPLYLMYNPDLLKGMMNGIFEYTESGKWTKPFPAHDLGKYPVANGQLYGEDMPVEEAGNMIILMDAIARVEKNAAYAKAHWNTLTTWVAYLDKAGLDPGNQLCTDDFAGHLARNANLSVKAIVAIGCYADLARQLGQQEVYSKYHARALEMAQAWMKLAAAGDHYSLVFEKPDTWSQKYNLVWDKILQLNIFPQEVYDRENAFYQKKQNTYGLPLDSRKTYTKSDWIIWTATLNSQLPEFKALVSPVYRFAMETPSKVPLSDWHETETGKMVGFQARSVVGGYYIKILADRLAAMK